MVNQISCNQLEKLFDGDGTTTYALKSTSISFEKGDFIAIIGPSGSGKSTLLHIIGSVDKPTSGRVLLEEYDIPHVHHQYFYTLDRESATFSDDTWQRMESVLEKLGDVVVKNNKGTGGKNVYKVYKIKVWE